MPLAHGLRNGKRVYLFAALPGDTNVLVIGRGARCQVRIHDNHVSEVHALLEVTRDGYLLRDSGSSNGTWVDAQRIDALVLRVGMRVQIGKTVLVAVDAKGRAPILGYRVSDFCRNAVKLHGNCVAAGEAIGKSREFVRMMQLRPEQRKR